MSLDTGFSAGGAPISAAVAEAAAGWLTLLMSGAISEQERADWLRWREASLEHERAWRHIETVSARWRTLPAGVAYASLSGLPSPARRRGMKALLALGAAAGLGALASRDDGWRGALAQHRTATGERRRLVLADGTALTLNTASAVDVRYDAKRRLILLRGGEVMITSGRDTAPVHRPLLVATAAGTARALGTRFTVRRDGGRTDVAVFEGAVELTPAANAETRRVLAAGEGAAFTDRAVAPTRPAAEQAAAWVDGQLFADGMPLGAFLDELARYRPGLLRCDPAVARLRLSGVFPLDDTDRVLAALPASLPVAVRYRTRYWVSVGPRA